MSQNKTRRSCITQYSNAFPCTRHQRDAAAAVRLALKGHREAAAGLSGSRTRLCRVSVCLGQRLDCLLRQQCQQIKTQRCQQGQAKSLNSMKQTYRQKRTLSRKRLLPEMTNVSCFCITNILLKRYAHNGRAFKNTYTHTHRQRVIWGLEASSRELGGTRNQQTCAPIPGLKTNAPALIMKPQKC